MRRWMRSAAAPPRSIRLMQRASVAGSPAASRSMNIVDASGGICRAAPAQTMTRGWPKPSSSRKQPTISPWVMPASAASTIRSNTFSRSLLAARCERVERAAHVALASLLLVGLEACDVLRHASKVGPLGCAARARSVVVLIAIDADHLLLAAFHPLLEGERRRADHGLDEAGFGGLVHAAGRVDLADQRHRSPVPSGRSASRRSRSRRAGR